MGVEPKSEEKCAVNAIKTFIIDNDNRNLIIANIKIRSQYIFL